MVYLVPYRAIHRKRRYQEPNWFARVASINSSEVCTQIRFRLKFKYINWGLRARETLIESTCAFSDRFALVISS